MFIETWMILGCFLISSLCFSSFTWINVRSIIFSNIYEKQKQPTWRKKGNIYLNIEEIIFPLRKKMHNKKLEVKKQITIVGDWTLSIVSPWSSDTIKRIQISNTLFPTSLWFFCLCYFEVSSTASRSRNENDLRVRSIWERPFTVTSHCLSCRDATTKTKKKKKKTCQRPASASYIYMHIYGRWRGQTHQSAPEGEELIHSKGEVGHHCRSLEYQTFTWFCL